MTNNSERIIILEICTAYENYNIFFSSFVSCFYIFFDITACMEIIAQQFLLT